MAAIAATGPSKGGGGQANQAAPPPPDQYENKVLAAMARVEAAKRAAIREQQERLAQEEKRAVVARQRARAARKKVRDEALAVEAQRVREQKEKVLVEQRQEKWRRERAARREELAKLRFAAAAEGKVQANVEERDQRFVEKDGYRDRPWRLEKAPCGGGEVLTPQQPTDPPIEVPQEGIGRHRKGMKPDVPRHIVEPRPVIHAPRAPILTPHEMIIEEALAQRGRQEVDMASAKQRRDKFERLRAAAGHTEDVDRHDKGNAERIATDNGTDQGEVENGGVVAEDALVEGDQPQRKADHRCPPRNKISNLDWLSNLQDDMGHLKNQMEELKSDQSNRRGENRREGFDVGQAKVANQPPPSVNEASTPVPTAASNRRKNAGVGAAANGRDMLGKIAEDTPPSTNDMPQRRDQKNMDLKRFLKSQRRKNRKVL